MSKSTLGTLAVIIVVALGIYIFMGGSAQAPVTPETTTEDTMTPPPPPAGVPGQMEGGASGTVLEGTTTYTLEEIATHKTAESCWSTVEGGVYDLTNWINKHPGGPQAILGNLCGKDGTTAFEKMHGQHPTQKPQTMLATFKIRELAGAAQ